MEDKHDQGSADTLCLLLLTMTNLGVGTASAVAQGQGNAYAAGNAQEHSLKERAIGQEATRAKAVGSKQVDHLGIEG